MMARKRFLAVACLTLLLSFDQALSQNAPIVPGRLNATRAELQALLAQHEQAEKSPASTSQMRGRARYEASLIKQRLEHGDFQVGDRIAITVDQEPAMSDTVTVGQDLTIDLASGERLSVRQVLRSEVHGLLQQAIAKVVKNPVVRTETFLRIGIMGAVGAQGFYVIRSDALITDVLMNAGGLSGTANLEKIKIERDSETIWEGEALKDAITQGRTVDQLNLMAGDMVTVPQQGKGRNLFTLLRGGMIAASAIFALLRWL
jgi:protein involved in polysaccharide export with SLBB domain